MNFHLLNSTLLALKKINITCKTLNLQPGNTYKKLLAYVLNKILIKETRIESYIIFQSIIMTENQQIYVLANLIGDKYNKKSFHRKMIYFN
jgi:hypothetical protein